MIIYPSQQSDRQFQQQIILVSSTSEPPNQSSLGNWVNILTYGGVAVAVIFAIAFLNQIQFRYLIKLVTILMKKKP